VTQNLTYSGTSNAITISNTRNVTLDLMGFSLSNAGVVGSTKGIHIENCENVEIRNGWIRWFQYGIDNNGSIRERIRVINIKSDMTTYGIYLASYGHLIKGCTASNSSETGLYLESGLITDCVSCNNMTGIRVLGPGDVLGSMVYNNATHNFHLGKGVATAIMVDRNSAFGLSPNYYVEPYTTGVQWGINAGAP